MRGAALAGLLAMAGCGAAGSVKNMVVGPPPPPGTIRLSGFIGGVVADEPRAALVGRDTLARGGNAADAVVAMGYALAVTYPSRASLGAGGACLSYRSSGKAPGNAGRTGANPEAIMFTSVPGAQPVGTGRADRPAAVPMLARGLFALYARDGSQPFETLISPAIDLARDGTPATGAFAQDLAVVSGPLLADPAARAVFSTNGAPLTDGAMLRQPDLATTLTALRTTGVGDLYQGNLASRFTDAANQAGAGLSTTDLRDALPRLQAPVALRTGKDQVAFLPPPADGGLAAAAAFIALEANPSDVALAQARAVAVAAAWRKSKGSADPQSLLQSPLPAGSLPALPASTSFGAVDRRGNAVICVVSMNNLFGTGRIAPGTGILLAASPAVTPLPLLAAGIAWNPDGRQFRAAASGTGQLGAPLAAAAALEGALGSKGPMSISVPDPGRANVIACTRGLPGAPKSCGWATDPRGAGLAIGGD